MCTKWNLSDIITAKTLSAPHCIPANILILCLCFFKILCEIKMLRSSLLSAVRFPRKYRHIISNVYCSTSDHNHLYEHLKETKCINTAQMKEIKQVKLNEEKKKQKIKKKKIAIKSKECTSNDYLQSVDLNLTNINEKHFMKTLETNVNALYLIDEKVATKYVSMIIKDLLKNTCFVAEINPGFGIVTKKLLEAGVSLIHLFEEKTVFHPILKNIHNQYPDRLDVRNFNFIYQHYKNKDRDMKQTAMKQMQKLLQDVENKKWESETCMQIVGVINNELFFKYLVNNLIFRNSFMTNGRPVFYSIISPSYWHKYTCDNSNTKIYTFSKVMFQIMFHYELLGILDRKAFLPSSRKTKFTRTTTMNEIWKEDHEKMYVIKLEPRPDLYSLLTEKDWIIFWYFVRYHMQKRSNRLIPLLEQWVPGCGIRLIAKNYTIFTQIGDLTPTQILEIFKEFKSWPEYKESYFITSNNESNIFNEISDLKNMND